MTKDRLVIAVLLAAIILAGAMALAGQSPDVVEDESFKVRISGVDRGCLGDELRIKVTLTNLLDTAVWVDLQKVARSKLVDRVDPLKGDPHLPIGMTGRIKAWDDASSTKPTLRFLLDSGASSESFFMLDTDDKFYSVGEYQIAIMDLRTEGNKTIERHSNQIKLSLRDCKGKK